MNIRSLFLASALCAASGLALPAAAADSNIANALHRQYDTMVRANEKKNMALVLSLYEPGAVLLPPRKAPIVGLPGVKSYFAQSWPMFRNFHETLTPTQRIIAGDYVTDTVFLRASGIVKGKFLKGETKMLYIWHRGNDGRWRLIRDMWN